MAMLLPWTALFQLYFVSCQANEMDQQPRSGSIVNLRVMHALISKELSHRYTKCALALLLPWQACSL